LNTPVAETLALLAALSFALGTTLQQRGALQTKAAEGDPHFLAQILREPIWWCGAALQACGWVLQALALDRGSLVVVQSLCTLSLVFALPLGRWLTRQAVGRRAVAGACLTVVGITAFVAVGQAGGGVASPTRTAWWTATLLALAGIAALGGVASRHRGSVGAALYATAAGLAFAFQAAVTKEFMGVVGHGLGPILSSWTTYALLLSALLGFGLQQSALKTGFLAPAMAASNASTLVASVALGALVFDERLVAPGNPALPALVGLAAAVAGVILLAVPVRDRNAPSTSPSSDVSF
jgi:drug/metabolite transporter (DMT)-like permease